MVHVPAARVQKEMIREPASIWFVPAEGTDTHAILLKAPTNVLKAIVQGCRLEFIFGLDIQANHRILCTAAKVYDDLVAPFIVSGVQLSSEEHQALCEVLYRPSAPIYFFDELNRCVSWTEASFDRKSADAVVRLVGSPARLHIDSFDEKASKALDNFDLSLDPNRVDEFAQARPDLLPEN